MGEGDGLGPHGVAGLAADPAWRLTLLTGGRWSVAERSFHHEGRHWVVGLTPAAASVALIVWCDGEVVGHERGDEAAMCSAALQRVSQILSGR